MANVKDMLMFVLLCESKSPQILRFIDLSAFKSCEQACCGSEHCRKGADRTHNPFLKAEKGLIPVLLLLSNCIATMQENIDLLLIKSNYICPHFFHIWGFAA